MKIFLNFFIFFHIIGMEILLTLSLIFSLVLAGLVIFLIQMLIKNRNLITQTQRQIEKYTDDNNIIITDFLENFQKSFTDFVIKYSNENHQFQNKFLKRCIDEMKNKKLRY